MQLACFFNEIRDADPSILLVQNCNKSLPCYLYWEHKCSLLLKFRY
jgi:hypothetical protein